MIEFRKVKKKYDNISLDLNLKVNKGEVLLLVGKNASGKTSSFKILLGVNNIESGTISINGEEIKNFDKNKLGLVLQDSFFPPGLTPGEIGNILKDTYNNFDIDLFYKYLQKFDLPVYIKIEKFSLGMVAKLKVIAAICHNPEILILDEPTIGLDLLARDEIMDLIRDFMDDDKIIIISSHLTSDFEKISDKIAFIKDGKIILQVTADFIDSSLGLIKSGEDLIKKIDEDDLISLEEEEFSNKYLVKNREKYMDEDLIMEKAHLDDLIRAIYRKGEFL